MTEHYVAVAAVLQLPHILRNASGRYRRAAVVQHPLFGSLAKAIPAAIPLADLQVASPRLTSAWHLQQTKQGNMKADGRSPCIPAGGANGTTDLSTCRRVSPLPVRGSSPPCRTWWR